MGLFDVGGAVGLSGGGFFEVVDDVGVGDRHQVFGDGGERNPGEFFEFFVLLGGEFSFESGEAGGEGGGFVSGDRERRGPFHQLFEVEGFVAVEWCGVDVRVFGDTNSIDDHEPFFGFGVGGGGLEIGVVDRACASALHLFEVSA